MLQVRERRDSTCSFEVVRFGPMQLALQETDHQIYEAESESNREALLAHLV